MRNILLIVINILKATFRKRGNVIIYIFLPLLGVLLSLVIYGGTGSSELRVGYLSNDNGVLSEELKDMLSSNEGFAVSDVEEAEINDMLLEQMLDLVIVLPEGFTESVYSGDLKDIDIISLKGQETTVWAEQLLGSYTDVLAKLSAASDGDKVMFSEMYGRYKEGSVMMKVSFLEDKQVGKSMTVTSIGFLIMFMMLGTSFTSMIILKEKRSRTFFRICTAPVNSRQYILANAITSLLIVIIQIIVIQLVMKFVLHIDSGISDPTLFVILLMFGLVAIGIGLVITAFSSSSYMASSLTTLIMTPTCMLGGCFWEIDFMPEFMQKMSLFMPQRWAIDAVEKLQRSGNGADIYLNLLVLAAFALALILIASYRFTRTDNLRKFV